MVRVLNMIWGKGEGMREGGGRYTNIQPITEAFFSMQGNKVFLGIGGQTHGCSPTLGENNAHSLRRATDAHCSLGAPRTVPGDIFESE